MAQGCEGPDAAFAEPVGQLFDLDPQPRIVVSLGRCALPAAAAFYASTRVSESLMNSQQVSLVLSDMTALLVHARMSWQVTGWDHDADGCIAHI